MRNARMFLILFSFALIGVALVGVYFAPWSPTRQTAEDGQRPSAAQTTASRSADAQPSQKQTTEKRPSFDIVRAEPDGSLVMAGQAQPGWTVIVESNGQEVGRTKADDFGEWVLSPQRKLSKGEHSLSLMERAPSDGRVIFSKQRLALSLSDPQAGQPLVALTEEGKGTRVLQMPAPSEESTVASAAVTTAPSRSDDIAASVAPAPDETAIAEAADKIGFTSIDYEEVGAKSMLFMNGHGKPDSQIALYVNNTRVGIVTADATGRWSFSGNRILEAGTNVLRADLMAADKDAEAGSGFKDGKVLARAEVRFERKPRPTTAALFDEKIASYQTGEPGTSGDTVSGQVGSGPASASQNGGIAAEAETADGGTKVVVVRQGDTLWQIAERHYGDGAKYTQIFRNNKNQIRDPNWIYPDQRVNLP